MVSCSTYLGFLSRANHAEYASLDCPTEGPVYGGQLNIQARAVHRGGLAVAEPMLLHISQCGLCIFYSYLLKPSSILQWATWLTFKRTSTSHTRSCPKACI